jgi:DNA-binding response OmpR family regulator
MALARLPCDLVEASDGQAGVEKALAEKPDLIVMDVIMPRMNGFEACRQLRAHSATASIPIIIVTSASDEQTIQAGREAGCTDHLKKPFNELELLAKVQRLLRH